MTVRNSNLRFFLTELFKKEGSKKDLKDFILKLLEFCEFTWKAFLNNELWNFGTLGKFLNY